MIFFCIIFPHDTLRSLDRMVDFQGSTVVHTNLRLPDEEWVLCQPHEFSHWFVASGGSVLLFLELIIDLLSETW